SRTSTTLVGVMGFHGPTGSPFPCGFFLGRLLWKVVKSGADRPVPLRRLPVHQPPVMLPQHLHGVVGFSEPIATLLGCQVTSGLDASARSAHGPGPGVFRENQERFKKDEL